MDKDGEGIVIGQTERSQLNLSRKVQSKNPQNVLRG